MNKKTILDKLPVVGRYIRQWLDETELLSPTAKKWIWGVALALIAGAAYLCTASCSYIDSVERSPDGTISVKINHDRK